jgi:hypothetical protein
MPQKKLAALFSLYIFDFQKKKIKIVGEAIHTQYTWAYALRCKAKPNLIVIILI